VCVKYTRARAAVHPIDHSTHNTDARSSPSTEGTGANPLHHVQKEVGPVMKVVERKPFRNRKCDLEGNECHGRKELPSIVVLKLGFAEPCGSTKY
jgi:hypothetical protein